MKSRKNMNQGMARLLMALVIAFGVETSANAQFGGLLNKAKKAVKEKVTNNDADESSSSSESSSQSTDHSGSAVRNARGESKATTTPRTNPAMQTMEERSKKAEEDAKANGGITIKHKERGIMMGTYYPQERKWVRSDGSYVVIAEDGTAKWDDGQSAGKITATGFSTRGIPQMNYKADADAFMLPDGTLVGTVRDEDEGTLITYLGKDWMQTSAPIDHKTIGYLTLGMGMNVESIKSQIKNNEDQEAAAANVKRMLNPKRSDGRQLDIWNMQWLDGNVKGKTEEDDEWVFTNGTLKFNSATVARYEENILNNFYTQDELTPVVMGKYVNGGLKNRHGKYLGHVDSNWNVINASGKKVGYVKSGRMYTADDKPVGYCMGGYSRFIAGFVFFMYLKL